METALRESALRVTSKLFVRKYFFLKTLRDLEEKNFDPQTPEEHKNGFLTLSKPRGSKTGGEWETEATCNFA